MYDADDHVGCWKQHWWGMNIFDSYYLIHLPLSCCIFFYVCNFVLYVCVYFFVVLELYRVRRVFTAKLFKNVLLAI